MTISRKAKDERVYIMASMVFLIILGRLLFWIIFPQYGQGHESEIVFMSFFIATIAIYMVLKTKTTIKWPLFYLIISFMLSFLVSIHYAKSALFMMNNCLYILLFGMIVKFVQKREHIIRIIICCFIVSLVISVKSLSEIHLIPRTYSFLGWPTATASVLLLFIPGAILWSGKSWKRWLVPMVLISAFLSTRSMMPTLSLFIVLAMMFIKEYKIILFSLLFLISIILIRNAVIQSSMVRVEYLSAAIDMIGQHPILGTGAGTFLHQGSSPTRFVHNSYIQLWVELGLIGFLSISTIFSRVFGMRPSKDILERTLYFGIVAFLIDNITNFTLIRSTTSIYFWVFLGCYVSLLTHNPKRENEMSMWRDHKGDNPKRNCEKPGSVEMLTMREGGAV